MLALGVSCTQVEEEKPNVLFFFIDDMGYKDLACYGAKLYETPEIDALASQGTRFTQAYTSAAISSPARASVLTGMHPAKLGMWNHFHTVPKGQKILPQYLKEEGYQTWHIGKWHMGNFEDATMPTDLGFDVNIGGYISWAPGSYFWPYGIDENGNPIKERRCVPGLREGGEEGEYLTDRLTDEAIKLIKNRDQDKPFYLNLWHYAVHTGQEGKPELVEKYRNKIKEMGLDTTYRHDPKTGADLLTSETNAVYAAMIQSVDESVERVIATLKEEGLYENTLIVFYSDNGVTTDNAPCYPFNGGKNSTYEAGVRVPAFVVWEGKITATEYHKPVYLPDVFETIKDYTGFESEEKTDGLSWLPIFKGDTLPDRQFIWYFPDTRTHWAQRANAAIYDTKTQLKHIMFFNGDEDEMYHIGRDKEEQYNVIADYPNEMETMKAELKDFLVNQYDKLPAPPEAYEQKVKERLGIH